MPLPLAEELGVGRLLLERRGIHVAELQHERVLATRTQRRHLRFDAQVLLTRPGLLADPVDDARRVLVLSEERGQRMQLFVLEQATEREAEQPVAAPLGVLDGRSLAGADVQGIESDDFRAEARIGQGPHHELVHFSLPVPRVAGAIL